MSNRLSFSESIAQLFDNETYSDLTVKCANKSWKLNRAVVCSQSKVLHAACMTEFKEAQTGIIDLDDDDPTAVEVMLWYFYTGECTVPITTDVPGEPSSANSSLRTQVLTYNLADKFNVPTLMDLAKKKFASSLDRVSCASEYSSVISDVYTIPSPNDDLKVILTENGRSNLRRMLQSPTSRDLQETMRNTPGFAFDVMMMFINAPLRGHCNNCGSNKPVRATQASCIKCGKGGASWSD